MGSSSSSYKRKIPKGLPQSYYKCRAIGSIIARKDTNFDTKYSLEDKRK